jgi:hypothetical protein
MSLVLALAGAYNLAWAAWAVLTPEHSFAHSGMSDPDKPLLYPQLWQGIGMLVGLFGVGYLLAARDPVGHWGLVLVGLLGKVAGPLGQVGGVATGTARPESLILSVPNDLVWWVPFVLILRHAYRVNRGPA